MSPHTGQSGYHLKKHKQRTLVRIWSKGNPHTLLVEGKLVQPQRRTVCRFFKDLKQSYYLTQQFHSCVYIWTKRKYWLENIVCCYSVTKSCPTLCNPMDYSTPGCSLSPRFMSIELMMLSNHFILCHSLLPLPWIFPESRSFPINQFFASGGQSIGASASASVFPMNV